MSGLLPGVAVLCGLIAVTTLWRAERISRRLQVAIATVALLAAPVYFLWGMGLAMGDPRPGPDGEVHRDPSEGDIINLCLLAVALALWVGLEFVLRAALGRRLPDRGGWGQLAARRLLQVRLSALAAPCVAVLVRPGGLHLGELAGDPALMAMFLAFFVLPLAAPLVLVGMLQWSWARADNFADQGVRA